MSRGHRILPEIGLYRVADIKRSDLQAVVTMLSKKGLQPSTVRYLMMPLQVLFKRAHHQGLIAVNPVDGIQLPRGSGKRERIASPEEAAKPSQHMWNSPMPRVTGWRHAPIRKEAVLQWPG